MGDLRLLAVHPASPSTWRPGGGTTRRSAPRSGADARTWSSATSTRRPTTRRCARLAEAGYRSVTELANEGWQPTWPAQRRPRVAGGVPLPRSVQIDHVLVGPRLAAIGSHTV